jgi:hypothetical protein
MKRSRDREVVIMARRATHGGEGWMNFDAALWRTLQRAVVAFMPPLAGRRGKSRRSTLKRAPQRTADPGGSSGRSRMNLACAVVLPIPDSPMPSENVKSEIIVHPTSSFVRRKQRL